MTAPIDLAKARRLIEEDGRCRWFDVGTNRGAWVDLGVEPGQPCEAWFDVATDHVSLAPKCEARAPWLRHLAARIERECRAWDADGLRRLGLAVMCWGAAAMGRNRALSRIPSYDAMNARAAVGWAHAKAEKAQRRLAEIERDEARAELRRWRVRMRWRRHRKRDYEAFLVERLHFRGAYVTGVRAEEGTEAWAYYERKARGLPLAGPRGVLP